jgi:general secretion pathway protein D
MKGLCISIITVAVVCCELSPGAYAQRANDQLKAYSLQYVEPDEARRMLTELLGEEVSDVRIIADANKRQLVVSGAEDVHQLAAELIRQIDQRSSSTQQSSEPSVLKTYRIRRTQASHELDLIRKLVGRNARVTLDGSRDQVIVVTSESNHSLLEQALPSAQARDSQTLRQLPGRKPLSWPSEQRSQSIEVADPSVLFPRSAINSARAKSALREYQLRRITVEQCQQAFKRLLDRKLFDLGDNRFRYAAGGSSISIVFRTNNNVCQLDGDQKLVDQFVSLMTRFEDSQDKKSPGGIRFVPLRNVNPEVLNRAIRVWRQSSGPQQETLKGVQGAFSDRSESMIRPAGFVQVQPSEDPGQANGNGRPDSGTGLRRPSSDVEVQPLPDLDVLILRGRDPDVDELVKIIQEIERLSDETSPEIEVYFLRHVKGEALNELIEDVLDDLTGPLQGRIAITPLVKPNALLLIGWGEAVNAAKKLIEKLDRSVNPSTQMQVFSLKHAPAAEVSTMLEEFLNGRGGLAPDVNVTANPRTNSIIVNGSPRDMEEVSQLIQRLDVNTAASVNQARMVRLKNSLAADVAATITTAISAARGGGNGRSAALELMLVQPNGEKVVASGFLDEVTLTPDSRTNSIFVSGPEESLPLVEQLIEQLDESPAASAQIKVFQVSNSDASDLVTVLRSLFPEAASTSMVPQLATAEGESSMVPVRFSVDIRTNTIVATGAAGDLQIIEALLLRLDQTESQERVNHVYRLKNSPATDVAQAVNDFLRSERIVSQAAPGRQNPFQQIEQEVIVVPEPVRNSLIISATPRYFEQIMELVEDLDDEPPQVMIQVILAEVDLNNFHEFGVEVGLQDSLLFDRSLLGELLTTTVSSSLSTPAGVVTTTTDNIIGATNAPGFDFNNSPLGNSGSTQSTGTAGNAAGQALSHFSLGRTNSDLDYGGLVLSASSENVSVLLRALDQSGSMEVLSRPQVMTLDNQQAFIQVGQRVPRVVSSSITQFGQVNSVAMEDVGLLLGVTPRISPEGNVVMEIDAEKSKVGKESDGIPISVSADGAIIRSPRVDVTTAQTTVSAASGQTIVIGGLIMTGNDSITKKVPWLGDVPLLGRLFRYDGYTSVRKELLIILTPHVILGQSDAEYLKQVEMSRMSWVSSDVFDWLGAGPADYGTLDDGGVPVIYPDESPSVEPSEVDLIPTPDTNVTDPVLPGTGAALPVPPEIPLSGPLQSQKSSVEAGRVTRVNFSEELTNSDVGNRVLPESDSTTESATQKVGEKVGGRTKRWFGWLRGTDQ